MCREVFRQLSRCVAALWVVGGSAAEAQSASIPARYLVQHDTIRYELLNPFRMYWLRGADPTGDPVTGASVETQVWSGTTERPIVRVAFQSLGVSRFAKTNDYEVMPTGRVRTIDGKPPAPGDRGDLLMPLPAQPLRVGLRWTDTTGTGPGKGTVGEEHDETIRSWEVVRLFDTLGTHSAEIRARGTWHMQLSYWVDSSAGRVAWLDVKGPMEERAVFDVTHGLLLERAWKMNLRGRGVPPSGAADTVPAGLRSAERMRIADTPRTRFLLRALPGTDTSLSVETSNGAPILLHTVARGANRVRSSLSRNDGMVGVAEIQYDGTVPRSYEATWADSGNALIVQSVRRDGSRLVVRRAGAHDTTLAIPNGAWSVADYSMNELLVPTLLSMDRDGVPRPLSVYRPYPGHWDGGTASVRARAGLLVATLRFGSDAPQVLAFTADGDLLYGENSGPRGARRFPTDTLRQSRLRALLAASSGG